MNKTKKFKSRKWLIVSISEKKYNPYKEVSEQKKRPVLIWSNSKYLKGKVICFYCTTKFNEKNKHNLFLIREKDGKKSYVDISKIFFVNNNDINWKERWFLIKDEKLRKQIIEKINTYFCLN